MRLNLTLYRNEVVPVYITDLGNKVVNARELHSFLGVKDNFRTWIKSKIKSHKLSEEQKHYTSFAEKSAKGGRPRIEYILRLEQAKKIAMGTNNAQGDKVKDYFLECERVAKQSTKGKAPDLTIHMQRPIQIQNSKAINRHLWETQDTQAIGDYHRDATKAVCGKTPSQLKREAKEKGLPSKFRTTGREV